jgi:hypothetical protein
MPSLCFAGRLAHQLLSHLTADAISTGTKDRNGSLEVKKRPEKDCADQSQFDLQESQEPVRQLRRRIRCALYAEA